MGLKGRRGRGAEAPGMGAQINRRLHAPAAAPGMLGCRHSNVTKTPARGRMNAQKATMVPCWKNAGTVPRWAV